jgi:hypothetical protein
VLLATQFQDLGLFCLGWSRHCPNSSVMYCLPQNCGLMQSAFVLHFVPEESEESESRESNESANKPCSAVESPAETSAVSESHAVNTRKPHKIAKNDFIIRSSTCRIQLRAWESTV